MINTIYSSNYARSFLNWRGLMSAGALIIMMALVILFFPEILIAFISAILLFTGIAIVAVAILLRRSERNISHGHSHPMM